MPALGTFALGAQENAGNSLPLSSPGFVIGHLYIPRTLAGPVDPDTGFASAKKVVLQYNQAGMLVDQYDIDPTYLPPDVLDAAGTYRSIRFYNDALYAHFSRGAPFRFDRIWRIDEDHTITLIHDMGVYPTSDISAIWDFGLTFDDEGNIYVVGDTSSGDSVVYKLNSAGIIQWRKVISLAAEGIGPYGASWLLSDQQTLLITVAFPDGWEGIISVDITQPSPLIATEYWKLETPFDTTFGYFFDVNDLLVSGGDIYLVASNNGFYPDNDIDSTVAIRRGPPLQYYKSGFIDNVTVPGDPVYLDGGWCIDCDPVDLDALWVSSVESTASVNIYKFKKSTGQLLKTLALTAPDGDALDAAYFAIGNGGGGHGNGCIGNPGLAHYPGRNTPPLWGPRLI